MMSALVKYLFRDSENRTLLDIRHDVVQLLRYASIYTPSQSLEALRKDNDPSENEIWYHEMTIFLNHALKSLESLGNSKLKISIASLPWLQAWNPNSFVDPLRQLSQLLEFGAPEFHLKPSIDFADTLARAFPSKVLPNPTSSVSCASYLQVVDYNVKNDCTPVELHRISTSERILASTILCNCLFPQQDTDITRKERLLRINFTIFFTLVSKPQPLSIVDIPHDSPNESDKNILRALNEFRELWRRKADEPISFPVLIFEDGMGQKQILPKDVRLSTLYEMTFDTEDQNALSLKDNVKNRDIVRKACILLIAMYTLCNSDLERGSVLSSITIIPYLNEWARINV